MYKVGEVLKGHRELFGITQKEVSNFMKISEQFYGKIEKGDVHLPLSRARKAQEVLKIKPVTLINAYLEDYAVKVTKAMGYRR